MMYLTHDGMSRLYEVSCEELDFLNDVAKECGVTGSRVMGGGFGGCTINLVKDVCTWNSWQRQKNNLPSNSS
jgi:galactokinase